VIKLVQEYLKDLEHFRLGDLKPITSIDNEFITVLTYISIATFYCFLKIWLKLSYSIKPKPREWTTKSKKPKFDNLSEDLEPLRDIKEVETNILPLFLLLKCPLWIQAPMP
jgi:uncharacterized protein YifE (UPF0438 family)